MSNFSHKKAIRTLFIGMLGFIIPIVVGFFWIYFWTNCFDSLPVQLIGIFSPVIILAAIFIYRVAGSDDF